MGHVECIPTVCSDKYEGRVGREVVEYAGDGGKEVMGGGDGTKPVLTCASDKRTLLVAPPPLRPHSDIEACVRSLLRIL